MLTHIFLGGWERIKPSSTFRLAVFPRKRGGLVVWQVMVWRWEEWRYCMKLTLKHLQYWELTYPMPKHLWFCFPKVGHIGICYFLWGYEDQFCMAAHCIRCFFQKLDTSTSHSTLLLWKESIACSNYMHLICIYIYKWHPCEWSYPCHLPLVLDYFRCWINHQKVSKKWESRWFASSKIDPSVWEEPEAYRRDGRSIPLVDRNFVVHMLLKALGQPWRCWAP